LPETHDTVIVGGGQAGLAMSYHLRQRGREHVILERSRIAERWRSERWDSLHFQLPNKWLELPGKPYLGADPDGFSHHSDVIRFVTDYATEIDAPVRLGVEVTGLRHDASEAGYLMETTGGDIEAKNVVIATGPFQRPSIPSYAGAISKAVYQTDTIAYRNPASLPSGAVLVVGTGNSGCQIADELCRSGRDVYLSVSRHSRAPRRYRGRDVIWWYEELGRFDVDVDTFPGRRFPPTSIMTGIGGGYDLDPRRLGAEGVRLVGHINGADQHDLGLVDDVEDLLTAADRSYAAFIEAADRYADIASASCGIGDRETPPSPASLKLEHQGVLNVRQEKIGTIIWATGFRYGFDWIKLPILDGDGTPIQTRGATAFPGVYFLGLHWMHTFRSAILAFVGRDAAHIADQIDELGK
jgi:putative flavoprotein involved in K+ transport